MWNAHRLLCIGCRKSERDHSHHCVHDESRHIIIVRRFRYGVHHREHFGCKKSRAGARLSIPTSHHCQVEFCRQFCLNKFFNLTYSTSHSRSFYYQENFSAILTVKSILLHTTIHKTYFPHARSTRRTPTPHIFHDCITSSHTQTITIFESQSQQKERNLLSVF